jgi:hypothetical protein
VLRQATALLVLGVMIGCQASTSAPTPAPAPTAAPPLSNTPAPATGAGRIEVLNSADAAFARGDYAAASGLYERTLNTPPTGEGAPATAAIDQYAHFRDAVTLLADGREDDAKQQVDALQQGDASAPFARLASQLWDQYGMVGSVRGACAQVQPQITSQAGATLATLKQLGVTADPGTLCSAPSGSG